MSLLVPPKACPCHCIFNSKAGHMATFVSCCMPLKAIDSSLGEFRLRTG